MTVRHCQDLAEQEIDNREPYVFHPCHAIICTRFTQCGASQCNSTCTEYLNRQKDCNVTWGCRCADNQYLDTDGTCVTSEQCKACSEIKCERDRKCKLFVKCERSCEKYYNPLYECGRRKPTYDCDCPAGYVFNEKLTKCISNTECTCSKLNCDRDKICGPFTECNSTCEGVTDPETCSNEVQIGCHCPEGTYFTNDGKCVRKEECPSICDRTLCNRGFVCGPFTQCSATCTGVTDPKTCSNELQTGCHCPPDLYLSSDGKCIEKEQCFSTGCDRISCLEGMPCGPFTECNATCKGVMDPKTCLNVPQTGCHCPEDSYLSIYGNCVRKDDCISITCKECERNGAKCGEIDQCKRSCAALINPKTECDGTVRFGCDCPPGSVFESTYPSNENCIREEECKEICTKCYEMKRECKSFNYCERSCVIFDPTAGRCGTSIKLDCDCPDGYYHWNGECVTEEECRKNFGV